MWVGKKRGGAVGDDGCGQGGRGEQGGLDVYVGVDEPGEGVKAPPCELLLPRGEPWAQGRHPAGHNPDIRADDLPGEQVQQAYVPHHQIERDFPSGSGDELLFRLQGNLPLSG